MKNSILALPLSALFIFLAETNAIAQPAGQKPAVSLCDELRTLYDFSLLPRYLDHSIAGQVSSYDTTGGNEDGFSGKYSFVRKNPDSSLVLFDVQGPGVITRIWTPTPTEDSLDFIIDDRRILSIKYTDLFSGKVYPFQSPLCGQALGGSYCYFPILFQKNCQIICRARNTQFHQIQYKRYPPGTTVKSFTPRLDAAEKSRLDKVLTTWQQIGPSGFFQTSSTGEVKTVSGTMELHPGEVKTIFNEMQAKQGGRILGFSLDPGSAFEGVNKSIDIKINWDNGNVPAVYCPIADFFGYGFGKPSMQGLFLGSRNGTNYCLFPMPFDKEALIQIRNRKGYGKTNPVRIHYKIYFSTKKRNPEKEGKFYAWWNRETLPGKSHVLLDATGRGHYVGTILLAQGIHPGMTYFFEGDDSTSVDGRMSLHGTGSEDYFNGGWYALADRWDRKMSLPLHGCLEYSLPFARTGGYRLYLSDKIPFEKSIYQSIEHGPVGNKISVDYTSLGFYYGDLPPRTYTEPSDALTQIDLPDTLILYPQLIYFGIQGTLATRSDWKYNTGGLSYSFTAADESALKISLAEIPYGPYRLLLDFVQNPKGCSFSIWQGQTALTGEISGYNGKENVLTNYYLADLVNNEFKNAITIRFKTREEQNNFILNRIIFVRKTE